MNHGLTIGGLETVYDQLATAIDAVAKTSPNSSSSSSRCSPPSNWVTKRSSAT